jgi:hypothetical protein
VGYTDRTAAKAACVAQRDIRESRRDENGNLRYNDDIIRRMKGEAYLVDCYVTGSNEGIFSKVIMPVLT